MNDATLARLDKVLEAAFSSHPEFLRPMLDPRKAATVPWMGGVARSKRFLEWWMADEEFRHTVREDASAAAHLGVDADELRFVWDEAFNRKMMGSKEWVAPHAVQQYRAWIGEKLRYREYLRREHCAPTDPRHRAWRERQVNRTMGELGASAHENIIHSPFTIELSEGCSVGCWFCGVSAERKAGDFLYTDENRKLWNEMLTVLRQHLGPAAGQGFLYWATDPLDNPDYEKFGLDFARICGRFPQTTTAQAQKHIERVRALLKLSAEHGCEINRFSVLTLSTFKKILQAFTPEELLHTELVLQNREGELMQSNSGRARGARELDKRANARELDPSWREVPGTISCVSGFLINMVQRSVRLITPCASSDKWTNGYWILEEGTFRDATEFAALIEGMTERHMPLALRARDVVRLRRDIKLTMTGDEIRLQSYGCTTTITDLPHMQLLAPAVAAGNRTAGDIAIQMEDEHGWPAERVMSALNWLFDQGLLDEEPSQATVVAPPAALRREKVKETAS